MPKRETSAATSRLSNNKLLQLVVEEVDEARETYELAVQFAKGLPIRSFEDVLRLIDRGQGVNFADNFTISSSSPRLVPSVVFPIEDLESLITLLAYAVRNAPKGHAVTELTEAGDARRQFRRLGILGLPVGRLGPSPAIMGALNPGQSPGRKRRPTN